MGGNNELNKIKLNQTQPMVSVVVPAYNHEQYIQETINSIINQTYKNIELIIVDDGSEDSTWQKIQEMKEECEKRFVRIHFETKENEGTCKTFTKLFSLAQGEYIFLIASDDMAKPQAIETEINFLSSHDDYALCVGDNEFIDTEGKKVCWSEYGKIASEAEEGKYKTFAAFLQDVRTDVNFQTNFGAYNTLYTGNYVPNGWLIRKSILSKTGLFTSKAPLEDYWLMLQISKFAKLKYIDEILFSYRQHRTNTIADAQRMADLTRKTLIYENKLLKKWRFRKYRKTIKHFVRIQRTPLQYVFSIKNSQDKKYKEICMLGCKFKIKRKN